jgi:hypothetical protein
MNYVKILADYIKSNKRINQIVTSLVKENYKKDHVSIVKNYFIENIQDSGVNQEILISAYDTVDFKQVITQADIYKNFKIGDKVKLKYNPDNPMQKEKYRSKKTAEFGRNY